MKKLTLLLALFFALLAFAACRENESTAPSLTTDSPTVTTSAIVTSTPSLITTPSTTAPSAPQDFLSLSCAQMVDSLTSRVDTGLTLVCETLPSDTNGGFNATEKEIFRYHFFTDPDGVTEVAFSQPMISNIPFFLGILKTSSPSEAQALAEAIDHNVNYLKLLCVQFEKHYVKVYGNTVVLLMDKDLTRIDALYSALNTLAAS